MFILFIYFSVMGPMGSYHFLSRCSRQLICWYLREGRTHQPMQLFSRGPATHPVGVVRVWCKLGVIVLPVRVGWGDRMGPGMIFV